MKKINIFLFVLSILSLIGQCLLLPQMPDTVPIHWNAAGEADGFGSRYVTLALAAVPFILFLLFFLIPRIDPRKASYEKHQKAYDIFRVFVILLFTAFVWISNGAIMGWPVSINRVIPIGIGILLLVIGNYMPQIRSNYTFGIKTPWALESPYVWKKTHAAGGVLFCIYGILMILSGIFPSPWMTNLTLAVILLGVAGMYLYSWLLFRKDCGKKS